MSYRDIYLYATEVFEKAHIEEGRHDAMLLLEYVFGLSHSMYLVHMDEDVDEAKVEEYKDLVSKRANHVPLQYLTGTQEFMGLTFEVNESVLIPRQDTEILVSNIIDIVKNKKSLKAIEARRISDSIEDKDVTKDDISVGKVRILDMCTGSGCIAISLKKYIEGSEVTAVDISEAALEVADRNAKLNNVDVEFIQSDLFERLDKDKKYDIIVSNPPYIVTKVIDTLMPEVREYEPRIALDGYEDGLYFYRHIIQTSSQYIKECGIMAFEIGYDQAEEVSKLLCENGFKDVEVIKDLAGLDRVVLARCD